VVLRGLVCAGDDGTTGGQRGATGHAAQCLAGGMDVGGGWHCGLGMDCGEINPTLPCFWFLGNFYNDLKQRIHIFH